MQSREVKRPGMEVLSYVRRTLLNPLLYKDLILIMLKWEGGMCAHENKIYTGHPVSWSQNYNFGLPKRNNKFRPS